MGRQKSPGLNWVNRLTRGREYKSKAAVNKAFVGDKNLIKNIFTLEIGKFKEDLNFVDQPSKYCTIKHYENCEHCEAQYAL